MIDGGDEAIVRINDWRSKWRGQASGDQFFAAGILRVVGVGETLQTEVGIGETVDIVLLRVGDVRDTDLITSDDIAADGDVTLSVKVSAAAAVDVRG